MRGTRLDKWQVLSPIGTGGMGEVWIARHTILGHRAAIKVMNAEMAADEREVARFLQEGQIAAQLQHRHIVRVQDVGRAPSGRPYLVMELLEGQSLDRRMNQLGALTPRMAAAVILPACSALEYAHAAGVIHRDIKPANLFLAVEHGEEVLKVLDFGLARVTQAGTPGSVPRLTAPTAVIGTPKYMSPEQAQGAADIDGRADLWSLGVVAYRMLTGKHPFPDKSRYAEMLVEILHAEIPPPSLHRPDLGGSIDDWMVRALDRDRGRRFQSAREMAEEFSAALEAMESGEERTELTPMSRSQLAASAAVARPLVVPAVTAPTGSWDAPVKMAVPIDQTLPPARLRSPVAVPSRGERNRGAGGKRTLSPRMRLALIVGTLAWLLLVAVLARVTRAIRESRAHGSGEVVPPPSR